MQERTSKYPSEGRESRSVPADDRYHGDCLAQRQEQFFAAQVQRLDVCHHFFCLLFETLVSQSASRADRQGFIYWMQSLSLRI